MRIIFTLLSILFLLLAIASFITAIVSLKPTLESTIPGFRSKIIKTAIGTVTDVHTSSSSTHSVATGRNYITGSTTVKIQFHDEKGHLFQIWCNPILKNFKEKSTIKVYYQQNDFNEARAEQAEKDAKENGMDVEAKLISGTPASLFFWLERPILFIIIGLILLILRFPVGQFRNMYQ